jgi:transposase
MAGYYRAVDRDQVFLLPPCIRDWLPLAHPVWFVIEVIQDLDTAAFHRHRVQTGPGRSAYDPDMLLTLLVYASWQGVRSSRQIEARCATDVAFRIICAQDAPDHVTISRFRKQNAEAFTELLTAVVLVCVQEGMGQFGKVAIDGTKIEANASKTANVTLEQARRIAQTELDAGLAADTDEDTDHDTPVPPALRDPSRRAARITTVLAEIEAATTAKAQAEQAAKAKAEQYTQDVATGTNQGRAPAGTDLVHLARTRLQRLTAQQQTKWDRWHQQQALPLTEREHPYLGGRPAPPTSSALVLRARAHLTKIQKQTTHTPTTPTKPSKTGRVKALCRNLTDPDSRLMPTRGGGFIQGYNAQLAVTNDHLILHAHACQTPNDVEQAQPMIRAAQHIAEHAGAHTGRDDTTIQQILLDAGYLSLANLTAPGPDRLIAVGKHRDLEHAARQQPPQALPEHPNPIQTMAHRLQQPNAIRDYRRRGATVEPVNGHLKDITGLRRFLTRGLTTITAELNLAAATLNLRHLFNHIKEAN